MTHVQLQNIAPAEIEAESFRIIESELKPTNFSPQEFALVRRSIHATGDFSFSDTIRFHPQAIEAGLRALRNGRNIFTDVRMASVGISASLLEHFGGRIFCRVSEPETAELAKQHNLTRSEAAMLRCCDDNIGIVLVGNAPTALLAAMKLIEQGRLQPDLVIGVPVGFVNAAESKNLLTEKNYPFITALGRKGGTPVAVAMINALLRLAEQELQ